MRRLPTAFQLPGEDPPFTNSHGVGTRVRAQKLTDFEKVTVLNYARSFGLGHALTREEFMKLWPNGMHVHPALLDAVDEARKALGGPSKPATKEREVSTCATSAAKAPRTGKSSFASISREGEAAAPGASSAGNPETEKPGSPAARSRATSSPADPAIPASRDEDRPDSGFNMNLLDPLVEWHVRCYALKAAVCGRRKKDEWVGSLGSERDRVEPFLVAMDFALDAFEREHPRPPKPPLTGDRERDARRILDDMLRMSARVCELMLEGARAIQDKALAAIRRGDAALLKPSMRALARIEHLLEDEGKTARQFAAMTMEEGSKGTRRPKVRPRRRT